MKYTLNLFCASEFSGSEWGPSFLEVQDVRYGVSFDLGALAIVSCVCTTLAALTLRHRGRFVFK
jgi:hypothetical protein